MGKGMFERECAHFMRAILLAAGRGSRMEKFTVDRPKCLLEVGGRALIDWQLEALRQAGMEEIGIVRGYLGNKLKREFVTFFDNPRWQQTNMLASLLCAEEWLKTADTLVSYTDIIYSADTVRRLVEARGDIAISYDKKWLPLWKARFQDPLGDAESFRVDAGGLLLEIGHRVQDLAVIQGQYMGLLKFSVPGWQQVTGFISSLSPQEADSMSMTSMLSCLLERGVKIHAVPIEESWFEIDSENDLTLCESWLTSGQIFSGRNR